MILHMWVCKLCTGPEVHSEYLKRYLSFYCYILSLRIMRIMMIIPKLRKCVLLLSSKQWNTFETGRYFFKQKFHVQAFFQYMQFICYSGYSGDINPYVYKYIRVSIKPIYHYVIKNRYHVSSFLNFFLKQLLTVSCLS